MEYRFDFDDQLPDLPIAFDLDEVAELFARKLFGADPLQGLGGTSLVRRLQDVKYRPSSRCVSTYELTIGSPDIAPRTTIGVLEFTPDGILPRLYTEDDRLPWLARAADRDEMERRFSELPAFAGYSGAIRLWEIAPIRYKPGLHCVIRYTVQTPAGNRTFYGKSFSGNAEQLMRILASLHESSQESPDMPLISVPVAVWPDLEMVLQSAVPYGIEFTNFAYDPTYSDSVREGWMTKAGRALAALHQNRTTPSESSTIYDDLRDLHEYTLIMGKVRADLATKYEEVIERIITKADHFKEPKPVPSHGAMRTDQYILQGDRLAMIDLDGYCWANPARDVGNFLAYLSWKAIRQPEHAQFVERAGRAFVEGYLGRQGELDARWLSIYQAASLLKIAGRRFRSLTYKEWPLVIHLIHAASAAITEDLAELEAGSVADLKGTLVAHLRTSSSKTKFPRTFEDKPFPALWSALNAEIMNTDLTPVLSDGVCSDTSPRIVHRAKLLAYKPGKRGVIRYDLDQIDCQDYLSVFGKLYPEPNLSERAYKVMRSLYDEVFCNTVNLGVPKPIGLVPHLSMLIFVPAEGKMLGDFIAKRPLSSPDVIESIQLAGKWLAQLHTHPFPLEKEFRVENEVGSIREWTELISKKYPEESLAANHIADFLVRTATALEFDLRVPIHKDFHYEHILVNGGINVFDFDEMRLGDANFDLAHFCANFYLLAYRSRKHTAQFGELQAKFLEAYASETNWKMNERFLFFYTYSCLKLAKQLCKFRGPRPWPEGEEQRAQVWLMLEQGLSALASAQDSASRTKMGMPMFEYAQIRRLGWLKASRISKSPTSSAAIRVSHRHLS